MANLKLQVSSLYTMLRQEIFKLRFVYQLRRKITNSNNLISLDVFGFLFLKLLSLDNSLVPEGVQSSTWDI